MGDHSYLGTNQSAYTCQAWCSYETTIETETGSQTEQKSNVVTGHGDSPTSAFTSMAWGCESRPNIFNKAISATRVPSVEVNSGEGRAILVGIHDSFVSVTGEKHPICFRNESLPVLTREP